MKNSSLLLIGLVLFLFGITLNAQNQEGITDSDKVEDSAESNGFMSLLKSKDETDLPNDLEHLENKRIELIAEMYGMMYEINSLFTELERSESLKTVVDGITDQSMAITKSQENAIGRLEEMKTNVILPELSTIRGQDLGNLNSMSVSEGFRRILENKVQDVLKKTDQLSSIGAKVTELNNTSYVSQNFKKQISWSFAVLVGIVIIGFFLMAFKDEQIRKTIFSGDAGLQFITIFSIIIAIILFGITGALGGRELSALLGGISGYILGRSSVKNLDSKSA